GGQCSADILASSSGLRFTVALGICDQHADPPHLLSLLGAHRERPRCRAAEQRDERAPFHSITSSARPRSVGAMSIPIAFAVFRLITISNLVGCSTGSSPGFAPRKILST